MIRGNRHIHRAAATAAAIESLEFRRLLSAGLSLQGGVVHVVGTAGNDAVAVIRTDAGCFVEVSGPDGSGMSINVNSPLVGIRIDGGGGTDSLVVSDLAAGSPLPMTVAGPAGDTVLSGDGGYQIVDGQVSDAGLAHAGVAVVNGVLTVTGTAASDEIYVGALDAPAKIFVRVNSTSTIFDAAGITGVSVDGGLGDDIIAVDNMYGALHLPATLSGGAGNDVICGPSGRGHWDDVTVNLNNPGYMPTTLLGGDGDDTLCGGLDADQLVGGAGADIFRPLSANDVIVDPDGNDDGATDTGQGGNELPIIPEASSPATSAPVAVPPGTFATQSPIKHDGDDVWG